MEKIGMISLGCPKNQVDAEMLLARLRAAGYALTTDEADADVLIVNTCGFIEDAKREGIDCILDAAGLKKTGKLKALIVTGCMAQRYRDEIAGELPEVDAVVSLGCNGDIVDIVRQTLAHSGRVYTGSAPDWGRGGERVLTTPSYTAYLRIADGCDNRCSYCAIPMIRGPQRSRPMEDIVSEVSGLVRGGAKELVLIAQDTTNYGTDLYGECRLPELLTKLGAVGDRLWIRLLYTYPERVTDELLAVMASQPNIVRYLDMPIQHVSSRVLRAMRRPGGRESLARRIAEIRAALPGVTLRSTVIAGFPGESEEDFAELVGFIREIEFDKLYCFAYSREEGTDAAAMPDQIPHEVRARRREIVMEEQALVSERLAARRVGSAVDVLVEGYDPQIKRFFGRSRSDAPEIDGKVFFACAARPEPGDICRVLIEDSLEYDLLGSAV